MNKEEFQQKIKYQFENQRLLIQAFTHSSYANERHMTKQANNERLEFLGDAVLEIVTSEFLYHKYPTHPEGELTRLRASLVCEQTLSASAKDLNLGKYLLLGKGEEQTGGRKRKSVLSDALEAVIGAVYLDGGFANAKEFIFQFILNDIEHKQLFYDSKTILQEMIQGSQKEEISYQLISEEGPDHDKKFVVEVYVGEEKAGAGTGKTKKSAEQTAAYHALLKYKDGKQQN